MIKKISLIFSILFAFNAFSQKKVAKKEEKKLNFNYSEAENCLLNSLNKIRTNSNLDSLEKNDILYKAAGKKVLIMTYTNKAELKNPKETQKRVIALGGTNKTEEIILALSVVSGKKVLTPQEFADAAIYKWRTGKKQQSIIKNPDYHFASPCVRLDEKGTKAYVSIVFGNYYTFNTGAKKQNELEIPYTTSNKKLKASDEKSCSNCKKFNDYDGLAAGLYVEKGIIYIRYNNLKTFLKLVRNPKDGLAIDIIQRAQYKKPDYSIFDNNLQSKGILLPTVTKSKLISKNKVKPEKKGKRLLPVAKLDVELGKLPPKLKGAYELNLLIVQDGKLCKTIYRSYIEQGDLNTNAPIAMLLMPEEHAYTQPPFEPQSESTLITFTVPFEKNKSDYKPADMQPFLDALQEPDFFIEGLYITAYSSIEGDAASNAQLQKRRAESIVKSLAKMQEKKDLITNVKTSDSWNLFQLEMEDGEYDYLTKMSKEKAIHEINTKGLADKLEPILAKERFAQIIMDVTYDIKGEKEEKFSVSKFNQAVKKGDVYTAYKIQYYIGKKQQEKKYSEDALNKLIIPNDVKYSGLINNRIVLKSINLENSVEQQDAILLDSLAKLDPSNGYVAFNTVFCKIKLDTTGADSKTQAEIQPQIDALYKTNLPKKYVDGLNVEWQFKIIQANDTAKNGEKIVQRSIDKIKSFYNLKDGNRQDNLKLSYIFARFNDYRYATSLLLPFIKEENPNEELVFAFLSFSAKARDLYNSNNFVLALEKAHKINPERYCKLFGLPYLTFQVFDNPKTKAHYHQAQCK